MDSVDDASASRHKHNTKARVLTKAKRILLSPLRARLPWMRPGIEDDGQGRGHNSRGQLHSGPVSNAAIIYLRVSGERTTVFRNDWQVVARDGTGQLVSAAFAPDPVSLPLWKRVLDISCLLVVTPFLLPLVLFTALVIKTTSKGPLLFRQERIGFLGKRFTLFKFRTMIPGSETGAHEAHVASIMDGNRPMTKLDARGDARVIPCGRVLRAAGLDELPQLINVLRGEMSLVGPRPCLPCEYDRHLPWQKERFRALPGLTGLWQVSGKNRMTFNEMIDLDMQYVRTQSPWLDLKIILKTIPVLIAEVTRQHSQAGRPPIGDTTMHQIGLRLPKPMLAAIDEIITGRLDQPECSAIIRELLAEALSARAKKAGR
jgi:lipopolysaccharide/colanic/teichoic acid biosynthesis glycosyltransferase